MNWLYASFYVVGYIACLVGLLRFFDGVEHFFGFDIFKHQMGRAPDVFKFFVSATLSIVWPLIFLLYCFFWLVRYFALRRMAKQLKEQDVVAMIQELQERELQIVREREATLKNVSDKIDAQLSTESPKEEREGQ